MKLNKVKVLRILFKLSFLPYVLVLLLAIYSSIFGFTFIFSTCYGLEAFYNSLVLYGIIGCIYFPIFPIVFIYEIFYLIWIRVRKNNKRE